MSKVYIFGSSGFIGTSLYKYLELRDIDVLTVGRTQCHVYADLEGDFDDFLQLVEPGDTVVLLAAVSSPDICSKNFGYAYRVNVLGTNNLIDMLTKKQVKVIFSSSDVVFGAYDSPVSENSKLAPIGEYGKMKAEVENAVETNPLVKIIRFSYVMGPGDKYTNMLLKSKGIVSVFEGFNRNVVALADVLLGIYSIIKKWDNLICDKFNFSGTENVSRWELTELFVNKYCPCVQIILEPAPLGFWEARPKDIQLLNHNFIDLIEHRPRTVLQNIDKWNKL